MVHRPAWLVLVATLIGAFLGALVALKWGNIPIGLIAGAFIGYLLSDPRKTFSSPALEAGLSWLIIAAACFSWAIPFGYWYVVVQPPHPQRFSLVILWGIASVLVAIIGCCCLFQALVVPTYAKRMKHEEWEQLRRWRRTYLVWNLLIIVPVGIFWLIFRLPGVLWRKVTALWRWVCSDPRLLCAFSVVLGTFIGYRLRHPIIGALVGGLICALNYILSVRLRRLILRRVRP